MQNETLRKVLYKYRDWSKEIHRRIITDRELYLASPKDFNDPFDCRITQNFGLLKSDEDILDYIRKLGIQNEAIKKSVFDRIKTNREEEQEKWNEYNFQKQDEHYGVLSLSERWDSILMWGHYSNCHTGFCVGFYEDKLGQSGYFGKGGPVTYNDDFPSINPKEEYSPEISFIETHSKATDWEYEKEYRLLTLYYPSPPTNDERKIRIDKSCFAEIYIGIHFPQKDITEIEKLSSDLGATLYKVIQTPFKFKLERAKLI